MYMASDHVGSSRFTPTCVGTIMLTPVARASIARFTPTCVGTIAVGRAAVRCTHGSPPRAWGQSHDCSMLSRIAAGSPPRAWGQSRAASVDADDGRRFTPTCVGTTARHDPSPDRRAGSPPRAWGQRLPVIARSQRAIGSPPRAWGQSPLHRTTLHRPPVHPHVRGDNAHDLADRAADDRFTPTCVGTIDPGCSARSVVVTVHPHVRGDNSSVAADRRSASAVHPHVRGDNRHASRHRCSCRSVHPHVRGDNCTHVLLTSAESAGSPPRAWGQ